MSSTEVSVSSALQARARDAIVMFEAIAADAQLAAALSDAVDAIVTTITNGGRVLLCGNGGSSADAQHLAAELVGKFMYDREPWAAVALSDNVAAITAIGNDYSYEDVFVRGVRAHGRSGDVLVGLSTSGRSANVIAAFEAAGPLAITTVALVGPGDTPMAAAADLVLAVDGPNTARIQEGHKLVGHTLFELVEQRLLDQSR